MNPPPNLPFEPLAPPPARPSSSVPPPPPTPPKPIEIQVPPSLSIPKKSVEPEDIFSDLEKPKSASMGSRAPSPVMPQLTRASSYNKLIAMVIVALVVVIGAGVAFWWFVIRTPVVAIPIEQVEPPIVRPVPEPMPIPPPAPAPIPKSATSSTSSSTTTLNSIVLPTPVTTPPAGVLIPPPTSVTSQTPVLNTTTTPTVSNEVDTDKDGLTDRREVELGTDPKKADSDGDGISDGDEVMKYGTNPLNRDTDKDTYDDGTEIKGGYNPRGAGKCAKPDCSL